MKFKLLLFIFLLFSCSPNLTTFNQNKNYSAKGFAYIYNDYDFKNKIIKGKLNNNLMQISHQNLKVGTLLKITNPITLLPMTSYLLLETFCMLYHPSNNPHRM